MFAAFFRVFSFFFLMFAVFRLLPPQGGESVAPYQAFGAHPLMQITETLHIMHCSKSLYTNITPFFPTLQADPSDSANDTKNAPISCYGNRGRCGFMGNASGAAKPQCSRELTHARAAVLAWSLLYIFRVVLYTFWLMALLALVAAACLASSVSAVATAAFISA